MGCNKVAYAHHRDDIIETMLLSLIFEGRFYFLLARTYLDRMDLTVIRPIMFVDEADVIGFRNKYDLPVVKRPPVPSTAIQSASTPKSWSVSSTGNIRAQNSACSRRY